MTGGAIAMPSADQISASIAAGDAPMSTGSIADCGHRACDHPILAREQNRRFKESAPGAHETTMDIV
jgi:hypothetical protein